MIAINYNMKLLDTNTPSGQQLYIGDDSKELFEHNLKVQPMDWVWRDINITYNLNSQGYRCPEWEDCDWNNSVLFIGGSDIFGLGINEDQTVSYHFSKITGIPVINLGVNGISSTFKWINTIKLLSYDISPKAVVYLWSPPNRTLEFTDDSGVSNKKWGLWVEDEGVGKHWSTHAYQGSQFLRYHMMHVPFLWKCPCVQYTPLYSDLPWFKLEESDKLDLIDLARDLNSNGKAHPGPESHKSWANRFLRDIQTINPNFS